MAASDMNCVYRKVHPYYLWEWLRAWQAFMSPSFGKGGINDQQKKHHAP